jgi:NifU-like protein involved in Fe-S cluster formation
MRESNALKSGESFKELEEAVMEDMRKIYSEKAIEYFLNPRNLGVIQVPEVFARVTGPRRDTMEIWQQIH